MCTTSKIFGEMCLKARDTFFQYVIWNQGRDGVRHEGGGLNFLVGSDIQQKNEVQDFGHEWESPILILHKKQHEECAWYEYCNSNFEKSERVFSFEATNLQHVGLEMEKRGGKIFDGIQST